LDIIFEGLKQPKKKRSFKPKKTIFWKF